MMYFSPWQIDRLRARLAAYRLNTGQNGKPKTWLDVAQEILDSDATALHLPEADEDPMMEHESLASDSRRADRYWPLKGENLRKFVEGESKQGSDNPKPTTLQRDKLRAVCDFLIDSGYLSRLELKHPPQTHYAAYNLLEYFLGEDSKPLPRIEHGQAKFLTGEFRNCVVSGKNITESEVSIELSGDRTILLIKETKNIYRNPGTLNFELWRDRERKFYFEARRVSSGWGICLNLRGLIIFFMKNADDDLEPHVYSSSVVMPKGVDGRTALIFVRTPLSKIPAHYVQITEGRCPENEFRTALNLRDVGNDIFLFESVLPQYEGQDDSQDDNHVYQQKSGAEKKSKRPSMGVVVDFGKLRETKRDG